VQSLQSRLLDWFPVLARYGGLIGVFYEAVYQKLDRPYLLALFGAMMGLSELSRAMRPGAAQPLQLLPPKEPLPELPPSTPSSEA
jgi:hypothetical protein